MHYELPSLKYPYNALEPHFDSATMEIHHKKHHQAYVTKLNDALLGSGYDAPRAINDLCIEIENVPQGIRQAVRNNGGGHANHTFLWSILSNEGGGEPSGKLAEAIDQCFGNFSVMQQKFNNAALNCFGSGWVWLFINKDRCLDICSTSNQDNTLMHRIGQYSGVPVIGLDVWEHAYYLNYQNRRPEYIKAFWNIIDWRKANSIYEECVCI